ncbi:MAG: peptidylprolyl isomerase [Clostridiales bacterium]|nr:peptidylprolyl isomerase [Clostridiales bacterium]
MRKYAILVVILAVVVAVTSSCGLIVKDPVVDAQTVIIEVAGEEIVKEDVQWTIENVLDYQEYVYSLYGYNYDRTDEDTIAAAQDTAINAMIEEAVSNQKIREIGLDQFTEEELATIQETVDETYAGYINTVKSYYFTDTELTGEELDAAVDAKILEIGYSSRESLLEEQKQSEMFAKLKDYIVKDVTVTEGEIESRYNEGVADAITAYASDLTQYASDINSGKIIYFKPNGYRYVKNLLIKIGDDERTEIAALTSQISEDQSSLTAIEQAIAELPENTAEDNEDQQKTRNELASQVETLTAGIETETAELDALTAAAYAAVQPAVNIVLSRIKDGKDFDTLIQEFGEDTGMKAEPAKSMGYLVCKGLSTYVEAFVNEAMALQTVGDISDPFRTSYGVHIVQYASDLQAGQVPLSDIRDSVAEELLTEKQDTIYAETISQWVTEANAKVYLDRLKD